MRYFEEYRPAQDGLRDANGDVPSFSTEIRRLARRRAQEVGAALASESNAVRRVARWRRHHPTDEWKRLRRWLPDDEIRMAFDRLRSMRVLREPHWIIR